MNNIKTINWREELIKLFPEITIKEKKDQDEWCPKCNGIGLRRQNDYIISCANCYGKGIIKACECGNKIEERYYTACKNCRDKKEREIEKERFEKAQKIKYEDYDGNFLWNDIVLTKEEFEEELFDIIYDGDEPPEYIYATRKEKIFNEIDLIEIVVNKCEDGYEDMDSYFNYNDNDFVKAQELINKWLDKYENILYCYYEDCRKVILLDEIIEEIKKEVEEMQKKFTRME